MPKCSMAPPARMIAAGPISRRSTTADAPATSSSSAPALRRRVSASATGPSSCRTRSTGSSVPISASTRAAVASTAPSMTLSLIPGSSVSTSPTASLRKGCTVIAGRPLHSASITPSTAPGTAKGMILMVASISFAATTLRFGRVATVMLSSTWLMRSISPASAVNSPALSANRLTRPVEARERATRGLISRFAMRSAASSSGTSPASRRAAITSRRPASRSAAMAASSSTRPFFSTLPGRRSVWARTAPRASSSGVGPKIMRRVSSSGRRAWLRRSAPGWRRRSPAP